MQKNYGVDNVFQLDGVKEKMKKTWMLNYGTTSPMKVESVKIKGKLTKLKLYGNENYVNPEKATLTCLVKYGVERPAQNSKIFDRIKRTSLKHKDYIFPSGKLIRVQGNEPWCLDLLLQKYSEDEIVTGKSRIPEIWYFNKLTKKMHRYYCDIFIPKDNLIIEVKSTWTNVLDVDKIEAKENAVKGLGYRYKKYIFGKNKNNYTIYEK